MRRNAPGGIRIFIWVGAWQGKGETPPDEIRRHLLLLLSPYLWLKVTIYRLKTGSIRKPPALPRTGSIGKPPDFIRGRLTFNLKIAGKRKMPPDFIRGIVYLLVLIIYF